MKKDNPILDRSEKFAVKVAGLCKQLQQHKEFVVSNQLYRSATSIGANVVEAQGALSKADFFAKMKIADKEAKETAYWLRLLYNTKQLSENDFTGFENNIDEICRMLTSICRTTEQNLKAEKAKKN